MVAANAGELRDILIPHLLLSLGLQATEHIFNKALATDPFTQQKLLPLAGKIIALTPTDKDTIYICIQDSGIQLSAESRNADVYIEASLFTLLRLALLAQADGLQAGDIYMSGDAAIAQQFSACLLALEIDWEAALAQRLGDVAAHQLARIFQFGTNKTQNFGHIWQQNICEYLQEEADILPPKAAVQAWGQSIAILNTELQALEQRLAALDLSR